MVLFLLLAMNSGSRLGFRSNDRQWQTFSVTSTPIFDDQGGLRGVVASFHDVTDVDRAHKQLREAIGELERSRTKVISQNQMLEQTNESLQTEIERRKRVQDEREELNRQLIETSRLVGMADVASAVLHNVGNVLNSINVSVEVVMNTVKQSPIGDVALVASMLQSHRHDLPHFLSQDPQGKQIPTYLSMLAETVNQNSMFVERELGGLSRNVDHVRQVVSRQVDLARPGGAIREPVHFQDLMEQALAINRSALENCRCEIREEYEDVPDGITDRHQVIQVLVNLISNAANAMAPSSAPAFTWKS
jgi:signal transduction histidine kinase